MLPPHGALPAHRARLAVQPRRVQGRTVDGRVVGGQPPCTPRGQVLKPAAPIVARAAQAPVPVIPLGAQNHGHVSSTASHASTTACESGATGPPPARPITGWSHPPCGPRCQAASEPQRWGQARAQAQRHFHFNMVFAAQLRAEHPLGPFSLHRLKRHNLEEAIRQRLAARSATSRNAAQSEAGRRRILPERLWLCAPPLEAGPAGP